MSSGHCLSISSILVQFTVKLSTLAGKWTRLALGLHHTGLASLFPDQQKFLVWFSLVWLGSSAHDWNDDYSQEGKLTEWSGLSGRNQEMGQPHQDGLRVGRELLLFSKGKLGSGPTRRGMTSKQANEKRGPLPTLHFLHTHSHPVCTPFPLIPCSSFTLPTFFTGSSHTVLTPKLILTNHCSLLVSETPRVHLTHPQSPQHPSTFCTHSFAHHTPLHIYFTLILALWKPFHSHHTLVKNTPWPFIPGASQFLYTYGTGPLHPAYTACILSPTRLLFHTQVLPSCTIITHTTHSYSTCSFLTPIPCSSSPPCIL